jgi:uncharacterized protein with HEPN domain
MSKRDPRLLLDDILESSRRIRIYTIGLTFEDFIADAKTVDAVIRNFEIIGEAANRLPADFKQRHADVDWRRIRGFRNRIIHEYFGIDHEIVWTIILDYLPVVILQVERIKAGLSRDREDTGI